MRKTKFQIHDDKVFEGYSDNTSWNGFANPYFDEETYKQIVSYYIKKSESDEENLEYWNEYKTDFKNSKGFVINKDSASPLTVHGMGYGLCWHEVENKEDTIKLSLTKKACHSLYEALDVFVMKNLDSAWSNDEKDLYEIFNQLKKEVK